MSRTSAIGLLVPLLATVLSGIAVAQEMAPNASPSSPTNASLYCEPDAPTVSVCANRLLRMLRTAAERSFIQREGLQATSGELAQVQSYDAAFRTHDRRQRTLKLAELDQRLTDPALPGEERTRLEAFRTVLRRLAQYEADVDAGIEPLVVPGTEEITAWIEQSKLDASLYSRYGGIVGLAAAGPYAHGARATLIREYIATHRLAFRDPEVETAFESLLNAPPLLVHPGAPDFTPFWQRAIPSSYVSD